MKCDATALRVLYDDGRCYINNSFKVTKTFGLRPQTRVVLTLIINASLTSLHLQLFQNIFRRNQTIFYFIPSEGGKVNKSKINFCLHLP